MPRFPRHASAAEGLSDRVFEQLLQKRHARSTRVYPLHLGDTYLEPLPAARAEAQRTAERARLHNYAPVQGEPELIDAIVEKVQRRSGIALDRDCVQVMAGATAGLGVVCSALLEPGDELLLPAPFWPLIRGAARLRGAKVVEVPFYTELERAGFDPIAALEDATTPRTVAIYLNSPHNPTGVALPPAIVSRVVELALRHDLWVLTDEVYEDLWYDQPPESIWTRPELRGRVIVTHSVSKAYGLAGARVGFTHGPPEIMQVIRGVQTFYSYCAPRPMQLGAARALREGEAWLANARGLYKAAARAATEVLGLPMPNGGSFLFFDAEQYLREGESVLQLLERCLDHGVMLMPGSASGQDFERWVRLCYTTVPPAELETALAGLKSALQS
jgi:N-succinyldiaminopimelate aminotransferase